MERQEWDGRMLMLAQDRVRAAADQLRVAAA